MPSKKYTATRPAVAADADAPPPKQRKPRAPPSKPPGMSNAEWKADIIRRAAAATDRRNRSKKQQERAAVAAASARMMPPPSHHQVAWSQPSVGSPARFTPSPQPWGCVSSPGYGDGDVHGGFNPNTAFSHGQRTPSPVFAVVQYPPYNYSPPDYAASPTPTTNLCRGALLYSQASSSQHGGEESTNADMDDIIMSGSVAAAASPGFAEELYAAADVGAEKDFADEEEEDADEGEEEEQAAAAAMKGTKRKRGPRAGEPRVKWTTKEDECLAEAWKVVCLDVITGMNQSANTYWEHIKSEFDERKLVDPQFTSIHMIRGAKAMANHWAIIQAACNK